MTSTNQRHITAARSKLVADHEWARRPQNTRDGRRLVMTRPPKLLIIDGQVKGVEVHVRLYDVDGEEVPIDPVRQFGRPPLRHEGVLDPAAALWHVLWQQVDDMPNPDAWVP